MMKTAITVLQELMVQHMDTAQYECVAQSGPQHKAVFEYRCMARGQVVSATARSKKDAKQEAARLMLRRLAAEGMTVPPPYNAPPPEPLGAGAGAGVGDGAAASSIRSYKALLKELCQEYNLPGPEYTLEGDTGPAHARRFTARCAVGAHERLASATTKKAAQQLAAQDLYLYLRENLARITKDFVEEEALARAHERAMERYVEVREPAPWRPDMAQRVSDYHLGLLQHRDEQQLNLGAEALAAAAPESDPEKTLTDVAGALGLTEEWHELPAENGAMVLVKLMPTSPPLVHCARSRAGAAALALDYLRDTMQLRDIDKPDASHLPA